MNIFFTLFRRELGGYFSSLNGYVIISSALVLVGACFSDLVVRLNTHPTDMTLPTMFFSSWYFWLIMLLSSPLITMRSFAKEKSNGTYETLMTAPVNDWQVLMSKFCGALFFYAMIWMPVMFSMLILRMYIDNALIVSIPGVFTSYFRVLVVGMLYMAIGCFSSAVTKSQIVAGMLSFTLGMGVFMLGYRSFFENTETNQLVELMSRLSVAAYVEECSRGIIDTRPLLFALTLTFFFLFVTYQVLQRRRWK